MNLIFTGAVTLFLSGFVCLWLWDFNVRGGNLKAPLKRCYAILRLVKYGKVPTLCNAHSKALIQRKGKMALVDNFNCEICTKKSKLI